MSILKKFKNVKYYGLIKFLSIMILIDFIKNIEIYSNTITDFSSYYLVLELFPDEI